MKVKAWKNVDIECEVDVSLDDCIKEMLDIANEEGMPMRKKLSAIDGATRILDAIKPEMMKEQLDKLSPGAMTMLWLRLEPWFEALKEKAPNAS